MTQVRGRLFLLPSPIQDEGLQGISDQAISILHSMNFFIVERARTARRFISLTKPSKSIESLDIFEMPEGDNTSKDIEAAMKPLFAGHDMGILSEAGLPAIADPGSKYVAYAHQHGIEVVPIAGPSSIFLALMASGLEGQRFMFHGYLSAKRDELKKQLHDLEQRAERDKATQIWMEAPYRNHQVLDVVDKHVSGNRMFCIAAHIGSEKGFVKTKKVSEWKKDGWPEIHKVPVVFLMR